MEQRLKDEVEKLRVRLLTHGPMKSHAKYTPGGKRERVGQDGPAVFQE
jgi:hypothetical protein